MVEDCEKYDGNNGHRTLTPLLFQRTLIDGTRWGGDLDFCNRWRALGGKIWCDPEIVLGHTAKIVLHDSLGALMRRRNSTTLKHVADKIREGKWTVKDLIEAIRYDDNKFGAQEDVLALAVGFAAQADGPIIETGSGLTTVLMAAATEHTVYCLEHHPGYAQRLRVMAAEAGTGNIGLCVCSIKDRWYDLDGKTLPDRFAFGLNDGPPRLLGDRARFFEIFGDRVGAMVCDDADDDSYRAYMTTWCIDRKLRGTFVEPRAMVIK
jgi:hypothetical protein